VIYAPFHVVVLGGPSADAHGPFPPTDAGEVHLTRLALYVEFHNPSADAHGSFSLADAGEAEPTQFTRCFALRQVARVLMHMGHFSLVDAREVG